MDSDEFRGMMRAVELPPASVRVLVVDDAPCYRAAASELLRLRGYEVVGWAASGVEALEAVDRLAPGAVLLDVELPDVDGFTLAAQLKRKRADLAVLLVSADRRYAAANHGHPFVYKGDLAKVDLSVRLVPDAGLGADRREHRLPAALPRTSAFA